MVCKEHCPTADKAIRFKDVEVMNEAGITVRIKQPHVDDNLCIGCGICEYKCPLPGRSAIIVTNTNETQDQLKAIPKPSFSPYS